VLFVLFLAVYMSVLLWPVSRRLVCASLCQKCILAFHEHNKFK
jgi:hypothetical protein